MTDDRDERMRQFLADAMKPADPQRVAAEIAKTKAMFAALIEEQESLERRIAALPALKPAQPRDAVTDLIETQVRETAEFLRRIMVRDEEKPKG